MSLESASKSKNGMDASELKNLIILVIFLFGFWILISGRMEIKYLTIGFVSSLVVAWISRPLMYLPVVSDGDKQYLAFDFPIFSLIAYLPWLIWEIIKANIDVALIVLNPKLPIQPQVFTFTKPMSNPAAHFTLANSITLTPGTVTIDLEDNVYTIHAITDSAAEGLVPEEGEGEMQARVAKVFGEENISPKGGAGNMSCANQGQRSDKGK